MGIDIFLTWEGKKENDNSEVEHPFFCTTAGYLGYLREAYHGGPYATKILVREAFESDTCAAEIPAKILRQRLTQVTEPAYGVDGGHVTAEVITQMLSAVVPNVAGTISSGRTEPMTVEEAVRMRHKLLYNSDDNHIEQVVQSFRDFVALAEQKENETGKPCTVIASY